ncbi:type 2 lanthipeptide synthetase LanM family protein [Nocardiopsis halophila]|uniref:type 2 lanthipeptide synthetase LanM family protein n=1 Tax=Nocardiopsis halophila TaxID=141692 RepID=UPI00034B6405|nr:type 2 lanthipeptide synthetase LanM family protein [Nocardiopsis halophila]
MDRRTEHAAFLRERDPDPTDCPPDPDAVRAWKDSAYISDDVFTLRLKASETSEETLSRLIGGGPFTADTGAMDWRPELDAVLTRPPLEEARFTAGTLYGTDHGRMLFHGLVGRFLSHYRSGLVEAAESDPRLRRNPDLLAPTALRSLIEDLAGELVRISHRTLILELNVASSRGELEGATPEERYDFYDTRLLSSPERLDALFTEYPVLGRSMIEAGRTWHATVLEMLGRLADDVPELRRARLVGDGAKVAEYRSGLGDRHLGGRTVTLVTFTDGARVYYKPRSVEPERVYRKTIGLLNEHCPELGLETVHVLPREGYGWCAPVRYRPCADRAAVARFYRRTGGVLAALHFLGAVDVHAENLIAAGDQPIPIDLETVLQHTSVSEQASDSAGERAADLLAQSVMAPLVLPVRALGDGQEESVDISAIGGGVARSVNRRAPTLVDPFTDVMRIDAGPLRSGTGQNRPFLDGGEVLPGDHADDVVRGFTEAYDAIAGNKAVFRAVLRGARAVPVRYIARPTRRYALFLRESRHPDYLRSALDGERLLEKLWTAVNTRRDLAPLVEHERRRLQAGDIPAFHSRPGSTSLFAGDEVVAEGFFGEPVVDVLERKLDLFGPEHRATQLDIIEDALAALPRSTPPARDRPRRGGPLPVGAGPRDAARALLDSLADDALLGADDCTWIGINLDGIRDESIEFRPMTTSLYDGLAGMAFVFAYGAGVFGSDAYADLARRSLAPVTAELREAARNGTVKSVGGYSGIAGALYALDHAGAALGDPAYTDLLQDHLVLLRKGAEAEESPDLVSGLAGCGVVAGRLYERYGLPELQDIARVCAERLEATGVGVGGGTAWPSAPGGPLLGGFSHGAAGIGWGLLHMADTLGDSAVRDLGASALAYDQSLAVPGRDAWRDLRTWRDRTGMADVHPALWCHGATGIGISRLLAHGHTPGSGYDAQARSALRAVRDRGYLGNQCLCHGDFGNMELFALADAVLPEAEWGERRDTMAGRLRDVLGSRGFDFGRIIGRNVFGLMMGKAGVALSLLRLAAPGRVPSVLWLEGPVSDPEGRVAQ